jgi:hypothetical protein
MVKAAADLPAPLPLTLMLPSEQSRVPLGTLLVRDGLLTTEQLELALAEKEQSGRRIGEIVVARSGSSQAALPACSPSSTGSNTSI